MLYSIHFILFVSLCFGGVWSKGPDHKTHSDYQADGRISGGKNASISDYPYTAFLLVKNAIVDDLCTGVIVTFRYVLCTRTCIDRNKIKYIRIGSTNKYSGGTTYNPNTVYYHPWFDFNTNDYNLAIVETWMELDGTNARAINMVNPGFEPQENEEIIISGWGENTDFLTAGTVPVVSQETCAARLEYTTITPRMFCAGYEEGGVDICKGDYGGPAVLSSTGELVGLAAFSEGCGKPKTPSIYINIGESGNRKFINSVVH